MKFPSLKNLAKGALITFKRFPAEIVFALAGTIAATVKIELSDLSRVKENWCTRTILIANLGLLLTLAATLFTESRQITGVKKLTLRLAAVVIALLLIFIINPGVRETDYIRFLLFSLSFHLFVAFAAFTVSNHIQGFWQFNKTLFLRFLTSALYAAVLFLGLAGAIGAMNFLFNFKFEWDTFAILWVWLVGVFTTIFFLAGIPSNLQHLDTDFSYPKGLKIFTQYVLIPLATVYVVILLAYEVKILVQWELPKGLVSNLILGYAVFGILSLLLVYPIREQDENKWLKTYTRSFYFLLIPLLALLFTAVGTRVLRYGITEMRYFLIVLACWLLFITVYFLASKKQNIKLIPISLSLLTLFSIYGPQSAFSVAMYSQRRVLIEVFKNNHAFTNGKLTPVDSTRISKKDGNKAVATLDYLISKHDLTSLQPYFKQDLDTVNDSLAAIKSKWRQYGPMTEYELRDKKLTWAKAKLGLKSFSGYYRDGDEEVSTSPLFNNYTFFRSKSAYVVSGYDYMVSMDNFDSNNNPVDAGNGLMIRSASNGKGQYTIEINKLPVAFNIVPTVDTMFKALKKYKLSNNEGSQSYQLPDDELVFTKNIKGFRVTLKIYSLNFQRGDAGGKTPIDITFARGYYLIKKLQP